MDQSSDEETGHAGGAVKLDSLPPRGVDRLEIELFSAIGPYPLLVFETSGGGLVSARRAAEAGLQAVIIGVDFTGDCPNVDGALFDVLLSVADRPAFPYVGVVNGRMGECVSGLEREIRRSPLASAILCRVMRMGEGRSLSEAIAIESLAYSTLLGGGEFRRWLGASRKAVPAAASGSWPHLRIERDQDAVTVTLSDPATRNAFGAGMRDALFEALAMVLDDPSQPRLVLKADGACFSVGGDLAEFGTAHDLAASHAVRTLRANADLLDRLGDRAEVHLHGACIGAGFEIPMAAAQRYAAPDAFFQLPEISMGLIPGAGGTATVGRAVGRHRASYLALTGRRMRVRDVADWGVARVRSPTA